MKKLTSLLLALGLCFSLAAPALAAGHPIYIQDIHNTSAGTLTAKGNQGDGWSFNEDTNTLTLSGAKDIDVTMNGSCTVVLAAGTTNTLARLAVEETDPSGKTVLTVKGSGELRLQNGDWEFADSIAKNGVLFGVFDEVNLQDGLVMTGGMNIGDSGTLTLGPKVDNGYGWATHAYLAGGVPATYVRIAPAAPAEAPAAPRFTDVAANSPYAEAIQWAVDQKITTGKTAATFAPNDPCTIGQANLFLWRNGGLSELGGSGTEMSKAEAWAKNSAKFMAPSESIAETCTRSWFIHALWVEAEKPKASKPASFSDTAGLSADVQTAISWAVEMGITTGKTAATFAPNDPCTRGQIVTFLYRTVSTGVLAGV